MIMATAYTILELKNKSTITYIAKFVNLYVVDYWEFENSTYIERFNIDPNGLLP